jgi:ribonuclease VapC
VKVVIDSSVLIACLLEEPGWEAYANAISEHSCRISASNYLEAAIVVDSKGDPVLSRQFDELIQLNAIEVVPFTPNQSTIARGAYRDFGRGSGHPARLNYGDSFAYALAKDSQLPLLFVGNDFSETDLQVVPLPN